MKNYLLGAQRIIFHIDKSPDASKKNKKEKTSCVWGIRVKSCEEKEKEEKDKISWFINVLETDKKRRKNDK